jgi:hypothetical protein
MKRRVSLATLVIRNSTIGTQELCESAIRSAKASVELRAAVEANPVRKADRGWDLRMQHQHEDKVRRYADLIIHRGTEAARGTPGRLRITNATLVVMQSAGDGTLHYVEDGTQAILIEQGNPLAYRRPRVIVDGTYYFIHDGAFDAS